MFNENQKIEYINYQISKSKSSDLDNLRKKYINFFNRLSFYEEELNNEFSLMSDDEQMNVAKKMSRGRRLNQDNNLSALKRYLDWAIKMNLSSSDKNVLKKKENIYREPPELYKTSMLRDELDLVQILDETLKPENKGTIDNMYRCYLHLLYHGLLQDEIAYLLEKDVIISQKKLIVNNKIIEMSDILCGLLSRYLKMTSYKKEIWNTIRETPIIRTGYLLENTASKEEKESPGYRDIIMNSWSVAISKKLKDCNRDINQTNILLSGAFMRMYKEEQQTGKINHNEYLMLKKNRNLTNNLTKILKACETEYKLWKKAFYN